MAVLTLESLLAMLLASLLASGHCGTVASTLALWHFYWQCTSGHSCKAALLWNLDAGPGLRQLVVSAQRDQEWPIVGITLSVASLLLGICWLWTVKHTAWTVLHIGI